METAFKIIVLASLAAIVLHWAPAAMHLAAKYLPLLAASVSLPFPSPLK